MAMIFFVCIFGTQNWPMYMNDDSLIVCQISFVLNIFFKYIPHTVFYKGDDTL